MDQNRSRVQGYRKNSTASWNRTGNGESLPEFRAALNDLRQEVHQELAKLDAADTQNAGDVEREYVEVQSQNEVQPEPAKVTLARYSRRVLLPTSQPLSVEDITMMNQLYDTEGATLTEVHRTMLSAISNLPIHGRMASAAVTMKELTRLFQIVHDRIRRSTDQVTQFNDLTHSTWTREPEVDLPHQDAEIILEDFFERCEAPNDAEVEMLAEVCDMEVAEVWDWFNMKWIDKRNSVHISASMKNKARWTDKFRKRPLRAEKN